MTYALVFVPAGRARPMPDGDCYPVAADDRSFTRVICANDACDQVMDGRDHVHLVVEQEAGKHVIGCCSEGCAIICAAALDVTEGR